MNRPKLDLDAAIANIRRKGTPTRVFYFEHGFEPGIRNALCDRLDLTHDLNNGDAHFALRQQIRIQEALAQEFMRVFPKNIVWPGLPASTTAAPPAVGPIRSWRDFEAYPWPRIEQVDFSDMEWLERNLPDHIAFWAMTYIFQQVSNLFGFTPLCLMLFEDRDLVKAVTEKVGGFYADLAEVMVHFTRCGAITLGDDLGHKTGTLISPEDIREIFMPWHARIMAIAHRRGKLGFFHVCGQVETLMDDLIDTVGIDAKHSTQDVIEPITVSKHRWGDRTALLGGVDVDVITRSRPDAVRTYVRRILEVCVPKGGFALGVGNWVADSIPVENYLALHEEAVHYR